MSGEAEQPAERPAPGVLFVHDIRRSLTAWKRDPRLPITALGVAMLWSVPTAVAAATDVAAIGLIGLAATFALVGFTGTERLWYVASDRGERLSWLDVRRFTRLLWRRYLGLGIYVAIVLVVPLGVIVAATDNGTFLQGLLLLVLFAAIDVALTFATVVLAFTDLRAGDAVRHSLAVTREQWPACLYYVVVAPLAIQLLFTVVPRDTMALPVRLAVILVVGIFKLACQGATVLFYADRYVTAEEPRPPSTTTS